MVLSKKITGLTAFLIVLFTMPLGHAVMILMEETLGHEHVYIAAGAMGLVGWLCLLIGFVTRNRTHATFWGLFAGLLIWTGWVEFSFVYIANRFGIPPLMENGEVVTKPEYLLMPSSWPFLVIIMTKYFFGSKTGCTFLNWLQRQVHLTEQITYRPGSRNTALTTMMEVIILLWTFYLLLLFAYDDHFLGDRHPVTYVIAFGSLFCSIYLFRKLLSLRDMGYAIRYAIPTVIIFWNFVEILGRWDLFREIWVEPTAYWLEMSLTLAMLVLLVIISVWGRKRSKKKQEPLDLGLGHSARKTSSLHDG